jgi:dCTP deaminase
MSLLSYTELCELIDHGIIKNSDYSHVNSSSIDIRLGDTILREKSNYLGGNIELNKKSALCTAKVVIRSGDSHILYPNEFILAQSMEVFNLPNNISAEYKLKSSMARIGLEHLNAGWCDAGWNGSVLTLELKNVTSFHNIVIKPGDFIGQIVFFKHAPVPEDKSYAVRGTYNNDKEVSGVKLAVQYEIDLGETK